MLLILEQSGHNIIGQYVQCGHNVVPILKLFEKYCDNVVSILLYNIVQKHWYKLVLWTCHHVVTILSTILTKILWQCGHNIYSQYLQRGHIVGYRQLTCDSYQGQITKGNQPIQKLNWYDMG